MSESPWARLLVSLVTTAGIALMAWYETPEWQRQMIAAATRRRLRRAAARLARASGRRAMGNELAGRTDEAEHGYRITYRLSVTRDRL